MSNHPKVSRIHQK
jgi:hypothetical protein